MGMKYTTLYIMFGSEGKKESLEMFLADEIDASLERNNDMFNLPKTISAFADTIGHCFVNDDLELDEDDDELSESRNFIQWYSEEFGENYYNQLKKIVGQNRKPRQFKKIAFLIDHETYDAGGHYFEWNIYDFKNNTFKAGSKRGGYPIEGEFSVEEFLRVAVDDKKE